MSPGPFAAIPSLSGSPLSGLTWILILFVVLSIVSVVSSGRKGWGWYVWSFLISSSALLCYTAVTFVWTLLTRKRPVETERPILRIDGTVTRRRAS